MKQHKCSCGHGYTRYSHGCRCEICKAAKRTYMAGRRVTAIRTPESEITGARITHGTRFAYEERGCRCAPCVVAQVKRGRARMPEVAA